MWVLVQREAPPDAEYWPGRGPLAAIDAVVWPVLWIVFIAKMPVPTGIMGPFFTAIAVLSLLKRLHRALAMNHRYRFTTWRYGRIVAAMLLMSWVMKLTMHVG